MDDIRIERSQRKLSLMLLAAIGFVALGVWLHTLSPEQLSEYRRFNQPWLVAIVAWSSILFFGFCAVAISRKLFDRSPGLVISANGIHDSSSAISFGLIHWSEICAIRECDIMGQRFVVIVMPDYDKILRGSGSFKRKMHEANIRLCGSPVCISANPLKTDHASLLRLVQEQFAKHQTAT